MAKDKWGGEIEVNGIRPAWLKDDELVQRRDRAGGDYPWGGPDDPWRIEAGRLSWGPWISHIRLQVDHSAYRALAAGLEPWGGGDTAPDDWNGGVVLLRNGDLGAPPSSNWKSCVYRDDIIGYRKKVAEAGQPAVIRVDSRVWCPGHGNGTVTAISEDTGNPTVLFDGRQHFPDSTRLITFVGIARDELKPLDDPDQVTVSRMTRRELEGERAAYMDSDTNDSAMFYAKRWGLLREETPVDRFMEAHPNADRATAKLALSWERG